MIEELLTVGTITIFIGVHAYLFYSERKRIKNARNIKWVEDERGY